MFWVFKNLPCKSGYPFTIGLSSFNGGKRLLHPFLHLNGGGAV